MSEKLVCVADYESMAKRVLPKAVFDYYCSGADQQETLADNTAAFSRWRLFPRVLRDVSSVDLSVSVLGQRISMPVCVGATAMQRMAHPDGETATARATRAAGTGMMLSSWATSTIEEVRSSAGDGLLWMQLYIYKDRDLTLSLVRRAEEAGYKAIFVTVDTPYLGKRRDDVRNRFKLPPHLKMTNFGSAELAFSSAEGYGEDSGLAVYVAQAIDPTLCWEHIAWLKKNTHLPVVVKGVLRAEDALEALNHAGCAGDRRPEGLSSGGYRCLPRTACTLGARLPGTTVFVYVPIMQGPYVVGEQGVSDVLELMRDELHLAMALAGCCSLAEVNRSLVRRPEFTSRI
uniref:(S)-2-hydroxy-acid oxidase n=1 Tax=Hucho hucho TaxID=62062 RepID=A0A4W5LAV2_9TELE